MSNKTTDKSVVKCLGFCGFGMGSNITEVDVKDGRMARIRPLHYDQLYTPEELNAWKIEARGHVLEQGMKNYPPPLSVAYKTRTYSPQPHPVPAQARGLGPADGERNTRQPRLVQVRAHQLGRGHATIIADRDQAHPGRGTAPFVHPGAGRRPRRDEDRPCRATAARRTC